MLQKSASFVLASFGGSLYREKYPSPPHSLRPRRTAILIILPAFLICFVIANRHGYWMPQ